MISIILGLISLVLSILLAVGIHSITSFDIMSFSFFFIVPVGSIFIGTIACLGYYWGLFITNKEIDSWFLVIGLLIPIIAYTGTQYGYYATAYIDENMTLNYKMEGEHISNYVFDDSVEPMNFISYTKLMVESRIITFSQRTHTIGEVEGKPVVNWIFFIIDGLGSVFGSIIALVAVIRKHKYCEECKQYMKYKSIFKFPVTDLDRTISFQDIDNLTPDKIKKLFPTELDRKVRKKEHYKILVHWCKACDNGYVTMIYMEKNSRGKIEENSAKSKESKASPEIIKTLLELAR